MLGSFGELHPRVLAALDLAGPVVAFELDLDAVGEPKRRRKAPPRTCRRSSRSAATSPSWWTADVTADAVLRAARGADRDADRRRVAVRRLSRATSCRPGKKSLAIEVVFQPRERTLTDAEIEAAASKVVAAVTKPTGGSLR